MVFIGKPFKKLVDMEMVCYCSFGNLVTHGYKATSANPPTVILTKTLAF